MTKTLVYQSNPLWLKLSSAFSDAVKPALFPSHTIRYKNLNWAEKTGFSGLSDAEWIDYFAKFTPLKDNLQEPLALRYHGHQFTHYNPQLGDGRGFLYGQIKDLSSGKTLDFGTKGSGQTPYSRQGDGKLTLKGAVREALATAFLEHKGVNTSKTFSIIETGESLDRQDEPSPTRSAVLVRLSQSHIRFGTFQRLAYFNQATEMTELRDYVLQNYYPGVAPEDFFSAVAQAVAKTTAEWMIHGFVHGVLNTDNINITGESFDYGPYRFLPHYDPLFTAAYFDRESLYAYSRQPQTIYWNLQQLELALRLIDDTDENYKKGYQTFQETFESTTMDLFLKKLHLKPQSENLVKELFSLCLFYLEKSKTPYESFFHKLTLWKSNPRQKLKELFPGDPIENIESLLSSFTLDDKKTISTKAPQTLLIDEIESIWEAIDKNDDWSLFDAKILSLEP